MDSPKLVEYVSLAKAYAEAIQNTESPKADDYVDKINRLFYEIKPTPTGLDEIARLLQNENEGVRLWAAAHLLNYPQYQSKEILEMIKDSSTVISLVAKVTLSAWKNGNVTF